ncbi:hypothetical protein KCU98_g2281, partial [Aureobasidium melanogenum]
MTSENNQTQLTLTPSKSPNSFLPRIVSHVAALERGDSDARTSPLQTFPILESEYAQLDNHLEETDLNGFYHDKVRNDYNPSLGQLVIRKPTNRHIIFIQRFVELVLAKVNAQARILEQKYPTIAQRLLKLRSMSTSDIDLLSDDGKVGHKSPDISIGYSDRVYPQAVFEVAYNQDRRALERLAWGYIMGSVWRPLVEIEDHIENMDVKQEIKDQHLGECNPDHVIAVLSVRDLLDDEMLEEEENSPDIAEYPGLYITDLSLYSQHTICPINHLLETATAKTFGMSAPDEGNSNNDRSNSNLDINDTTTEKRPWRSDSQGVSHLGRDGVLRSLNADRTAVLDVRRSSPEEIIEFAEPFGHATMDALVGVDGRDVTDEAQLWAVPTVNTVADESRIYKPAVPADQKSVPTDPSSSTPVK